MSGTVCIRKPAFILLTGYKKAPFSSPIYPSPSHVGAEGVPKIKFSQAAQPKPTAPSPAIRSSASTRPRVPSWGSGQGGRLEVVRMRSFQLGPALATSVPYLSSLSCSPFLVPAGKCIWEIYSLSVRKSKLQIGQSKLPRDLNK